jgi:hypothetical protein
MDWPDKSTESSAILLTRLLYTHVYGIETWTPLPSKSTSCKQPPHAMPMDRLHEVSSLLLVKLDTRGNEE